MPAAIPPKKASITSHEDRNMVEAINAAEITNLNCFLIFVVMIMFYF